MEKDFYANFYSVIKFGNSEFGLLFFNKETHIASSCFHSPNFYIQKICTCAWICWRNFKLISKAKTNEATGILKIKYFHTYCSLFLIFITTQKPSNSLSNNMQHPETDVMVPNWSHGHTFFPEMITIAFMGNIFFAPSWKMLRSPHILMWLQFSTWNKLSVMSNF